MRSNAGPQTGLKDEIETCITLPHLAFSNIFINLKTRQSILGSMRDLSQIDED